MVPILIYYYKWFTLVELMTSVGIDLRIVNSIYIYIHVQSFGIMKIETIDCSLNYLSTLFTNNYVIGRVQTT